MKITSLIILLFWFVTGNSQPLTTDANTLLLLNFDNKVNGVVGEIPVLFNNIEYGTGKHGNALHIRNTTTLRFSKFNNINTQKGTLEFWIKPESLNPSTILDMRPSASGLTVGLGTWTVMDVNLGTSLVKSVTLPNLLTQNTWFHFAFTWDENSLKIYKNGQLLATTNVGYTLPDVNLAYFNIGSTNSGDGQILGFLDELRISDRPRTSTEILASYQAGNNNSNNDIRLSNNDPIQLYKTWKIYLNKPGYWKTPIVNITNNNQTYTIPNEELQWSVADESKADIINGEVIAKDYGTTELIGKYGNKSVSVQLNIIAPFKESEQLPSVDPFLSNPVLCNEKLMPVVIIAYFPTLNGTHIDKSEADQFFPQDITLLSDAKRRVQSIAKHTKFSLEEGSKFRGYNNPDERPYLGYKVIDIIYVYEPIPRNSPYGSNTNNYHFDSYEAIKRFGGENYVNNQGVKEFWVFGLGMHNVTMPESNMSSPTTGDVSNSYRSNDDLPIYNKTYIVYGYNYSRIGNEAVHNHGHQIESMMDHVNYVQDGNTNLFWQSFVGRGPNNAPPIGRCGDTHHPPNTTQDYDWYNNTQVMSDIFNWLPAGGPKTLVSAATTWGALNYPWPLPIYYNPAGNVIDNELIDAQSKWYIFWMQSIPGFGQQIPYGNKYLTNWWNIIYDWDTYYIKGLYNIVSEPEMTPCGNSNTSTLTFDIDDNVCGAINQTIDIPIRVKNFSKVSSFQFSLKINDAAKADIVSIEKGNVPGDLNTGIISSSSATVTWDNPSAAVDLADNSVVMIVKVRLKVSFTGSSAIEIISTPTAISAEQNNIEVIPTVIGGSYCIGATAFKLCGKITREDNVAIPNVVVTLSGGKNSTATTNLNGEFCFEDLQSNLNYVITPSKNTNHVNGVNTGDVTAIRRHILSLEKLNSPYKIIAADANASKAVNTGDVTEIRRLILSLISQFTNTQSWTFVPKTHVFTDPTNPFSSAIPSTVSINNLNSNVTDVNFVGIKIGDVNLSNNPSNILGIVSNRNAADINIVVGSANVIGNQNFDIDIKVKQFKEIVAGQFSINWDKTLADFVSIKNMNTTLGITNDNFNTIQAGKTGFIWDSPTPVTLTDDTRLFTISLKSKSVKGTGPIEITNDPVSRYFQNKDGVELNIIITNGSLTVPTDELSKNGNVRIYPNPTTGLISIESDNNEIKNLEVRSLDGRVVQSINEFKGSTIDLTHLAPGSYIVKGLANNYPFAKKVVIVR